MTIAELTAGLVWPTLLRSASMAMQPPRLLLGLLIVLSIGTINLIFDAMGGAGDAGIAHQTMRQLGDGLQRFVASGRQADIAGAAYALVYEAAGSIARLTQNHPVAGATLLLAWSLPWSVFGGALCRTVAVDVAGDLNMTAREGLGFAIWRYRTFWLAMLIPAALMAAIAVLLMGFGWLLHGLPGIRWVGALIYFIFLVGGLLLMFLLVGFGVGQALLTPAVAAEATDSIDAVQRAYAYVLNRPGRLLLYMLVLIVQGLIAFLILDWLVESAIAATRDWVGMLMSKEAHDALKAGGPGGIIAWWESVAKLLVSAFVVSFYFTGSTILYLLVRRVNDEQDIREIWMPGMIEGTLAPRTPAAAAGREDDDE
ncbi:MAG: hypothetical protein IBJ11_02155 [Phycisphaerales bacterium]|nr:hypothetical protein [Phycisphaerales bacterium]